MSTDGSVSVRENTGVNLTCEVDAVPAPGTSALRWYSNNSLIHTGQYYVISTVRRRDAGNYLCQTSNTLTPSHGSSQTAVGHAAFRLVVLCKHSRHVCTLSLLFVNDRSHRTARKTSCPAVLTPGHIVFPALHHFRRPWLARLFRNILCATLTNTQRADTVTCNLLHYRGRQFYSVCVSLY